ncbi:hypothetical protein GQ457_11G031780 [Hibiscus cannabinus]
MGWGLRQGDPLSPLLFVIVAKAFLLEKVVSERVACGVELVPGFSFSHLQFADVTILFFDASIEVVRSVQRVLFCFQVYSMLQINFRKSSLVAIGVDSGLAGEIVVLVIVHHFSKSLSSWLEKLGYNIVLVECNCLKVQATPSQQQQHLSYHQLKVLGTQGDQQQQQLSYHLLKNLAVRGEVQHLICEADHMGYNESNVTPAIWVRTLPGIGSSGEVKTDFWGC